GLLPDYTVPGLNDVVGYIISGLVGVAILLIPYAMVRRRK
ncbi:MAG: cobalamin biosynthesis protein, partial [Thermoproteota archaeon]